MIAALGDLRTISISTWLAWLCTLAACSTEPVRRPIGSQCSAPSECETGICGGGGCLSAEGDDDLDGLTNEIEAALGSDPTSADSDLDGIDDFTETRGGFVVDSDDDGAPDVLESMLADRDGDCIPDQIDRADDVFDVELSGLVPIVCKTKGVCDGALLIVSCDGGQGPRCEYGAVPRYEATEVTCDGRDNDCNGLVDEGQRDADFDQIADCVDPDRDGDGIDNETDVCPDSPDPDQRDTDGDGEGDACDAPNAPTYVDVWPASPSNVRQPTFKFLAEPHATIQVFGNAGCGGAPIAEGSSGAGAGGVAVTVEISAPVPANLVTRLSARTKNRVELASPCIPLPLYRHDDVPPAPPTFIQAAPPSPSRLRRPTIIIGAESMEKVTSVALYLNPRCDGTPAFSGAIGPEGTFTFTTEVAPNTELPVFGTTQDEAGNRSLCVELIRWRHDTIAPCAPRLANEISAFPDLDADVQLVGEPAGSIALFNDPLCSRGIAEAVRVGAGEIPYDSCRALWRAAVRLPATEALETYARATDAAGNVGPCAWLGSLRYDRLPPDAPTLLEVKASVWRPDAVFFAGRGVTEGGAEVEIHLGPTGGLDCAATPLHTTRADANGVFVFPIELPDVSERWVSLRARDMAGNVSPCGPAEALVGDVTINVPPLSGPSSLLISDERGGIIEEIPLITAGPPRPAPQTLTRRIVRGAAISLAHRPDSSAMDGHPDYILSHMDVRPFEDLDFGRGWFADDAESPLLQVSASVPSGAYSHVMVVSCEDGHWEDMEVRSALPVDVQVPPGCLVPGQSATLLVRPATSAGPTARATFVAAATPGLPQAIMLGPWSSDTNHSVTVAGAGRERASGLALLVGGPAIGDSPTSPQFWLEMTREYRIEGSADATAISLPSLAPTTVLAQAQMLVILAFDLFERIRVVSLPVPSVEGGAAPIIDLDAILPASQGLFAVQSSGGGPGDTPETRVVFPTVDAFTVTASFVEVRWNALGIGGRPLVWQVIQSSQRTDTRFPDLPEAPSLLASLRPPTLSASERGDLDRATHAVYAFADRRSITSARPILAAELFQGNLPGPPVLPRPIAYQSSIAPGRFSYE